MNSTKNKVIFLISVVIILFLINNKPTQTKLSGVDCNLTVGKTVRYYFADGFKDCIEYKYYVDGVKFMGYVNFDTKIKVPLNKFYKVKYSKDEPKISEMYLTEEITDSIEIIKTGFKYKKK